MDDRRFDELAKSMGEGASRRRLLKGLVGGGLAAALAAIGLGEADAADVEAAATCRSRCRRIKNRRRRRSCLRRCSTGGGGGGGGGTTGSLQAVSTNTSTDAKTVGESCTVANDCQALLTCNNNVCTACTTTCEGGTQCCTAGICQVVGEQNVCLLG